MILSELALRVGKKIGMTDATTLALIYEWADARHQMICTEELWKDLLSIYTLAVSASQSTVILPPQIDRPVAARYDDMNLLPVDQVFLFVTDPQVWDRTGRAARMAEQPSLGTRVQPTSEKLSLVSSNAADTAKTVSIVGELAGAEVRENLTLNGTTPVQSVQTYDLVYTLAKEATAGDVSVTGVTSLAALLTLRSDESARQHCRLRLLETPQQAITLMVLGKRKPPRLLRASDQPALRGIDGCLEAFVLADAYEWQRQTEDASDKRGEAMALLEQLKKTEIYHAANTQQLVPYDSDAPGDIPGVMGCSMGKTHW
jgi:hypothetical protein